MNPGLAEFAGAARRLCDVLERVSDDLERQRFDLLAALVDLYRVGLRLEPGGDGWETPPHTAFGVGREEIDRIGGVVADVVAEHRYYWTALEPNALQGNQELGTGDLVDDVQDIYADVVPGLRAWEAETFDHDAIAFEWQLNFRAHWGAHTVHAICELHRIVYDSW